MAGQLGLPSSSHHLTRTAARQPTPQVRHWLERRTLGLDGGDSSLLLGEEAVLLKAGTVCDSEEAGDGLVV